MELILKLYGLSSLYDIEWNISPSSGPLLKNRDPGQALNLYPYSDPSPYTYTITFPVNSNNSCLSTYTMQVNKNTDDLTLNWVFHDFLSPNGDYLNDVWTPAYKGIANGVLYLKKLMLGIFIVKALV